MVAHNFPDRATLKLTAIPKYGELRKHGVRLRVGDIIYLEEIENEAITYTNLVSGIDDQEDFFEFGVWYFGEILTGSAYSDCLKATGNIPNNGIYRYVLTIVGDSTPIIAPVMGLNVIAGKDQVLKTSDFSFRFSQDEELYFFADDSEASFFNLGVPVQTFTYTDIRKGKISVRYDLEGTFRFKMILSSTNSKNTTTDVTVVSSAPFAFTGNNVFYAEILTKIDKTITTNRDNVIFFVEGSTTIAPEGVSILNSDIIEFTEFNDFGLTTSANGPGYNKLIAYRNYENKYYWSGLPKGTAVSSRGRLVSAKHVEKTSEGSDLWVMPAIPAMYTTTVTAIDTVSGETITRQYHIIVNYEGFGPEGQEEEIL